MKNLRQVFLGIIIALASIGLLLGGLSLSLAEGKSNATSTTTSTATPSASPTLTPTSSPTWQPFTPSAFTSPSLESPTLSQTWTPSLTPTLPAPPANCAPPAGWLVYFVQPGETLDSIATRYRISSAELQTANCLVTTELIPGVVIYVPPMRTQTPLPCGAPYGWIVYTVQPGDTLYRLSVAYGITVADLQRANCLGSSTLLHTGQLLYVPSWLPHPASSTAPVIIFPTSTQVYSPPATFTIPFTSIPTDTLVPAASDTPAEVPTATAFPVAP
ncbi:MAG: LysM peptidoglycan-binding domain-containing protein [Anaerolineales bacterium]